MVSMTSRNPDTFNTELLVLLACEKKAVYREQSLVDKTKRAFAFKEFSGKKGEEIQFQAPTRFKAKRLIVRGIGPAKSLDAQELRKAVGAVVKKAMAWNIDSMMIAVPDAPAIKLGMGQILSALMEGANLANFLFDGYLADKKSSLVKQIYLATDKDTVQEFTKRSERVNLICEAALIARSWVSTPSNDKTPLAFAGKIEQLFEHLPVDIARYEEDKLVAMKFGAMLGVAKGSLNKPVLMTMDANPGKAKKTVVLVGKGVTFDSGGLDLKTAEGMGAMKMDMAGAAAVAATVYALSGLAQDIRVVGVTPLVENMPSGDALRPGDIVRSYSGKSIEIGNTDAEGRLILADALAWAADTYKPDLMIDLATLTGACMIGLGDQIAGHYSEDMVLSKAIHEAGDATGDWCWPMPLHPDYKELLKSDFADINNLANSKYGGSITAALFLSEFVKDTRWAHLDIAGPAYSAKGSDICPPGGTGFGVRLLCELICGNKPVKL